MDERLKGYVAAISESVSRKVGEAGVITIVNSKDSGKRISLSKELMEELGQPNSVNVVLSDDSIGIGVNLELENVKEYNIRIPTKKGEPTKKGVLYAAKLVEEIADKYDLDFNEKVCLTFSEVEYSVDSESPLAFIKIK